MISEIFFSLLAKKLMDRHFFYCYWLKIDSEKIALPGERSQTMKAQHNWDLLDTQPSQMQK